MILAIALALLVQTPNDPYYPTQAQLALGMMRVPQAWEVTTGSVFVPIVDVDAGVQMDHPDLTTLNPASDVWDLCDQHGTLMAGNIAADVNNGIGIAGVLWESNLTVYNGGSTRGSIAASIDRARTDTTAKIVLIDKSIVPVMNRQPLSGALNALWNDGHRLAIVPAGGMPGTPGVNLGGRDDPNILVVGACNFDGTRASYSPFGRQVDIWAPGHATSTAPTDGYGAGDGTSISAAYLAAIAGLVGAANPALNGGQIKDILIATATPMACGPVVNAEAAVLAANP